jgi:dolichol-phosphate mannosyltransferase subunit 3
MSGLLRYQIFLMYGALFIALWYGALSTQQTTDPPSIWIVYAPVWAILLLGLYALGSVMYGVTTLKDCPEAASEIERQIVEAKAEMKKRGIIKD